MPKEHTGSIYSKSPMTGNYYHVTRWYRVDEDKIIAKEKNRVEPDNIPNEWLERLDG